MNNIEFEITIDNIRDIKKSRLEKGYVALFHSHNCGHCVHFIPVWNLLKKKLSDKYKFIEIEYTNMQKIKNQYNITFSKVKYFPYICIYSPHKKKHIEYQERERDEKSLTNFIKSNLNELLPTELNNENILDNINKATTGDKKGYMILVHSKKCGYCIRFMPLWIELKEKYNNKVQFFELERDELNKIRDNGKSKNKKLKFLDNIKIFPSIIIYNNDNQNFINYEKERNIDNLSYFIENELLL